MEDRNSFESLICKVQACKLCSRMEGSSRVLGHASGSTEAKLMFIGEAPGRLGADASAIPFHGDKAGSNFEKLLRHVGLSRYDLFITNAALCNPKDERGNNATPTDAELRNCSKWLKQQIELVDPEIVVTLGARSLAALNLIEPHSLQLNSDVRSISNWFDRKLIPLYHPGSRALIHRSFANQLSDYQFVYEQFKRLSRTRRVAPGRKITGEINDVVRLILQTKERVGYFALHKICYLVEHEHYKAFGRRLTESYVVRQKDGPYFTDLHLSNLKKTFPEMKVVSQAGRLWLSVRDPDLFSEGEGPSFGPEQRKLICEVIDRFSGRSDSQLKTAAYLTRPMKEILRDERSGKANWYNKPIVFG